MAALVKTVFVANNTNELPVTWEGEIAWLQPSTGKWFTWSGTDWEVSSAPLIVVPDEVALDTEAEALVMAHEALPNVHHASFVQADHDDLPNPHHSNADDLTSEQKTGLTAGGETALHSHAGGSGDMTKSVYDPNEDGVIALTELDPNVCSESEADSKISTHAGNASAHHAKYTDAEAVSAAKADADVSDAISKKHSNSLDHDGAAQDTAIAGKLASTAFSGLSKITVGSSAPSSPSAGDLWVDTS